ncbi:pimeloyl-CoA dehydrogenase small subunit [Sinimarinibacterium sp. CAU 1509]|uniref:acyl-CoA dehydrogenase family protein n=1 Tax=Sinimarinibacterium sp. CAU 1509 TaxID=2562283 RepID=UPI0010AC11C5|nr:acyl-CoA dehydrogenase family protein [Sinimarinibacterium sp. CAU 1509]TJY59769.1 pimeloyl-CoA dehydrogenase small subunit [Sinimarinibacterium sp. CAU 1509]
MDFTFTEEQHQFQDSLQRFVRKDYDFERRRAIIASDAGWSREVWQQLAEMGVMALALPEAYDGFGGGGFDTLLVMEALGRGMVVEPYLATVVLGAGVLIDAGSAAQRQAVLPAVAAGERLLALAHDEPGQRYASSTIATTAQAVDGGYRIDGQKSVVLHGAEADQLIVSARTAGDVRDAQGISLFLVDATAPGVERFGYPTQDGLRAASIRFNNVRVGADALIGTEHEALAVIEKALDRGIAALCAEAVGNMTATIEATVGYLKTRKQFGVPIGTFQALQHRAVDMYLHAEQARSMAYLAAAKLEAPSGERRQAVSAAKVLVSQSAHFVGQQAVQLHGGIGVTDELAVSHYFKRLTMISMLFGDADFHLDRFGQHLAA